MTDVASTFQITTAECVEPIPDDTPCYALEVSYNEGADWRHILGSDDITDCHRQVIFCTFDGERRYRIRRRDDVVFWQYP